jgi:hypothetical protein
MCEKLAHLRDTLTEEQIRDGVAAQKMGEQRRKENAYEEMKHEVSEDIAKALIDGLPNAKRFGFDRNLKFDIKEFTKKTIQEHDSK